MSKRKALPIRELCYTAIFTAIIAVCAQIQIQQPSGIPFTLQTWGIALAGLVLGPKKGALAALAYILLGAAGAPVFALFTGGFGIIAGPTGGFILSFPLMALIVGLGDKKGGIVWMMLGLVAGTAVNLFSGMLYFSLITSSSLQAAFAAAVAPFLIVEIIKIATLPLISKSIKAVLKKAKVAI